MTEDGRTRRDLLRSGAGIGAATALGGLAGCLSSLPGIGGDGGGSPWYARWLPSRSALGDPRGSQYRFLTVDVAVLRENEGEFSAETYRAVTGAFRGEDNPLPGPSATDRLVSVRTGASGNVLVLEGSFAASDLAGGFTDQGYTRRDEHDGFALYASEGGAGAVGLADGTLVARGAREDAVAELAATIDVGRGNATRLADGDEDADALVSNLGTGLFANGVVPAGGVPPALRSGALMANGLRGRVSGDTADLRQVLVYDAASDVDTDAVRNGSATADQLRAVTVEGAGRAALVEGTLDTAELTGRDLFGVALGRGPGVGREQVVPQAAFDFEYDEPAGTLEITHEGGDTFDEDNTEVLRYGIRGGAMEEWPLPVQAGDRVTLERDFSSGDEVQVVWASPEDDRTAVVAEFQVP